MSFREHEKADDKLDIDTSNRWCRVVNSKFGGQRSFYVQAGQWVLSMEQVFTNFK